MKSLFFRLFVSFLLAMLLSGLLFFALRFLDRDRHHPPLPAVSHLDTDSPPGSFRSPPAAPPDLRPPPGKHRPPPFFLIFGLQTVIFLIVGGIICYLLAWRLTALVRTLRQAVQRFTDGELTVRSGFPTADRGDEIADLGHDFDRMAERIESLLLAQKQLARDISHELRSPLARLQVALGLARRHALPSAEGSLDRIEREVERLNELIGELLTLSLLENGAGLSGHEEVDLREVAAEIAGDADFEAAESARRVICLPGPPLAVHGNRELLRRALENVVRNGLHYTAAGTAVTITLDREEAGGAVIRVADHGPGVPEEMCAAIFQPFYRVAEARDRQSGGAGIGLAITARAVALHGGDVTARNRAEGGLEVEIRLPSEPATGSDGRPACNVLLSGRTPPPAPRQA